MKKFHKKKALLTDKDVDKSQLEPRLIEIIEEYKSKKNLKNEQIRILDWGCGIGTEVFKLREHGYSAFGVEINEKLIRDNLPFFKDKGYDNSILQVVSVENETNFPDEFFDIIISNQVFEHVADIESLFSEMNRILKISGIGFHRFPARKRIKEVHLLMPFVHWLPKNRLRKYVIAIFVLLGIEPRWTKVKEESFWGKVDVYYQYSVQNTFYRKNTTLKKVGEKSGLEITCDARINPRYKQNELVRKLLSVSFIKKAINALFNTFRRVELYMVKKP